MVRGLHSGSKHYAGLAILPALLVVDYQFRRCGCCKLSSNLLGCGLLRFLLPAVLGSSRDDVEDAHERTTRRLGLHAKGRQRASEGDDLVVGEARKIARRGDFGRHVQDFLLARQNTFEFLGYLEISGNSIVLKDEWEEICCVLPSDKYFISLKPAQMIREWSAINY